MDNNKAKFTWLEGMLAAGLALITVGIGVGWQGQQTAKVELIKAKVTPTVVQGNNKVTFDIAGEVLKPGVYVLPLGSRISEALTVAGGLSANADRQWVEVNINRAKKIGDGEKIYIPKKVNSDQLSVNSNKEQISKQILGSQIININSAGVEELDKLDGVGPAIAQRIIDYREKNGGFVDINELKLVSGIGEKMFEKIKDKVEI
ncbi:MAG: helix-hairpin-helix domain-containing protein [Microgenomates group bacterium]